MPEKGIRSTYSQCPFQILICDAVGVISTGTGFHYVADDQWFLVTNWHNVSGRHPTTKEPISSSGRLPTHIEAKFATYEPPGMILNPGSFTTAAHRIELYSDHSPAWFEHPVIGSRCDVVAIPFSRPSTCPEFMHNAANRISPHKIPVEPGGVVFIIGFPHSLSVGIGLPIWKSGYIASEPHYDVTMGGSVAHVGGVSGGMTIPAFFIDSQTRAGMSGSPVFASYVGNWDLSDPYAKWDIQSQDFWKRADIALSGKGMQFVGCYSGRSGKKEEEAALGFCWKVSAIEEICTAKKLGINPHILKS